MAIGEYIASALGTMASFWKIGGPSAPRISRNGAAYEIKDTTGTSFAVLRGGSPVGPDDFVTRRFVDEINKPVTVTAQFNGNNALPANTVTAHFSVVTTTGPNATIGQLLYDDGSGIGSVQVVAAADGRSIFTADGFNGGTVQLEGRSYYTWNTTAAAWQLEAEQQTVSYYVNTGTGNDNNDGSLASPFATFAKAWAMVRPFQIATINLAAAQTFVLPSTTSSLTIPIGSTIYVVGVYASQVGARTALAAGSTTTVIQDAAGGLGVNASRGDWLQWDPATTTVALRGTGGTVRSNTAGAFTLFDAQAAVPSNTDTFTIQRTTSVLQSTASAQIDLTGGAVYADRVQFQTNAAAFGDASLYIVGRGRFYSRGCRWLDAGLGKGRVAFDGGVLASIGTFAAPFRGASNLYPGGFGTVPNGFWDAGDFVQNGLFFGPQNDANVYCQNLVFTGIAGVIGVGSLLCQTAGRLSVVGLDMLTGTCGGYGEGTYVLVRGTPSGGAKNSISGANNAQPGTFIIDDGARGEISFTDISNTSLPAIYARRSGQIEIGVQGAVTGSANTIGVQCDMDATVGYLSSTTVTGATGDTSVDGVVRAYAAYANTVGSTSMRYIRSNWSTPGSMITWSGTFVGAVGLVTAFYGQGGSPVVNLSSATALRFPMPTGSNVRNLRGTILANPLATSTTFTIYKAPVATGVPASTALAVTVTAGATGSVSDIADVVAFQDGDQIDLRSDNTGGGIATMSSTWAAQAA